MARKSIEHAEALFSYRHRAVCADDNFKSPWFADIELARQAARIHRQNPENEDHIIRIVTEQTISTVFVEE